MAAASSSDEKSQDETVISMLDVLEEEKQYEEAARAVLGGSDANQCTYQRGYLPRQALYACATCIKPETQTAGVCLACSLECHDGHDLYELYTKRNFRCDCGNEKFPENECKFFSERDNVNENNIYNQNFKGAYCTCARPYPDPEDDIEDDMLQCVVCEDWHHGRHTGCEAIPEDYEEFICETCCKRCAFLFPYATLYPKQNEYEKTEMSECDETSEVNVESVTKQGSEEAKPTEIIVKPGPSKQDMKLHASRSTPSQGTSKSTPSQGIRKSKQSPGTSKSKPSPGPSKSTPSQDTSKSTPPQGTSKSKPSQGTSKSNGGMDCGGTGECLLKVLRTTEPDSYKAGGRFWPAGWRSKLCVCQNCMTMYADLEVTYLCDDKDTISEYEARGKAVNMDGYEKGMEALQSIDRTQQVEVLTEYATMKNQLTEYLKKFAESGKVVREEDIKEFFAGLKANKRQRTGLQYFCR